MTLDEAQALDAADPLAFARDRFVLPEATIYLDGNSLGALPKATSPMLFDTVERQWGEDLITSWNEHGWIDAPVRVAAKLTPLIEAGPNELLIADSTSVCLFKLLAAAAAARPDRTVILAEEGSFPTDLYVVQGLAALLPHLELRTVAAGALAAAVDEDTAVLMLTHVDYRSGATHDMAALNAAARDAGALNLWDLSHSAGWMGHADPFAFESEYRPAPGIARFLTGTPSILALAALEAGLDTFAGIAIAEVEAKARRLTTLFVDAVERRCGPQVRLFGPRSPELRGAHVSFAHPQAYPVVQALIARGVVGDFRQPDLMRFGFAPLYNRFEDAWRAAEVLGQVLDSGEWDQPRFRERQKVT